MSYRVFGCKALVVFKVSWFCHSSCILKEVLKTITSKIDKMIAEDIPILQEISNEETGDEYNEEISIIKTKQTTPYVIIDNNYEKIRYYNRESAKRLQELIGIWKIDKDAINDVNKELYHPDICSRHFNYNQNTVYSKNLKNEHSTEKSEINCHICFVCKKKKFFFSCRTSYIEHT
ncbi:2281_t:CDS:2 [Cetraspora pellucida]|uniref:2281_t:CDS:1 n=1 Tax=Cetraspora pellucida TaxID=1433469 RepID=A0A9N9FXR7_9GLOM|nr:2281_t:CDS:2 [Cetraspora pellucida]